MDNPNPARITDALWWLWGQLHQLEPASQLGGIYATTDGYHDTRDNLRRRLPRNYSIQDAVDKRGPGDKAAALDWTFPDAQRGDYRTIAKYSRRLEVSSHDMDDPRLNGLREWYGQNDNDRQVEGWDCRYLVPVSSDSSHLWHIHFSFTRAYVEDFGVMRALLSVLRGESYPDYLARTSGAKAVTSEDEDMPTIYSAQLPTEYDVTVCVPVDAVKGGALGSGAGYLTLAGDPGLVGEDVEVMIRAWYLVDDGAGKSHMESFPRGWNSPARLTKAQPFLVDNDVPAGTKAFFVMRVDNDDPRSALVPVGATLAVGRA